MRMLGIVVEYNPLHNGHVHHYEQSMKAAGADACIAVMSGHFLQRGEPAVVNKWARTEMALRMGADVVIELPVAYACQPAEWFAFGAVCLLEATGVVDALSFGSEDGRIDLLQKRAGQLFREDEQFRSLLQAQLKKGGSYPAAYAAAAALHPDATNPGAEEAEADGALAPDQPNNILGLHYLMALRRLESHIHPLTIPRQKAGYRQAAATDKDIASATAIRSLLFQEDWKSLREEALERIAAYVPSYTLDIMRRELRAGRGPLCWEHYASLLFARLLAGSEEELRSISEVTEGLEHRLKRSLSLLPEAAPRQVESLLQLLKTKRYTYGKLQRTLLRILLQHPKHELSREKLSAGPAYIRILGFSGKGRELLKMMKRTARLPVITRPAQNQAELPFLAWDIRASSVYSLAYKEQSPAQWLRDYYQPPLHPGR